MKTFFKICVLSVGIIFIFTCSSYCADPVTKSDSITKKIESVTEKEKSVKSPSIFFPVQKYKFDQVVEGTEIIHNFVVINRGAALLEVQKVKTG